MLGANQRDRLCGAQGSTEHTHPPLHTAVGAHRRIWCFLGDASDLMNLCKNFRSRKPVEKTFGLATMGVK